ncbi:MAG: glycosyltransferase family 1 protein [Actinomycetota bacterium]
MRVALIAEQLRQPHSGGVGTYVEALARNLPAFAGREDRIELIGARAPRGVDPLSALGLTVRDVGLPRPLMYEAWHRLRRPAIPGSPDLIHATSLAVPPAEEARLVVTVHDLAFARAPAWFPARGRRFHARGARLAAREARLVLVPSQAAAADVKLFMGVDADRVRVTPLGVRPLPLPPDAEERRKRLGVQSPYVLWVGTREPRKNVPGLVRAFARAASAKWQLVLAGPPGWLEPDITGEAERAGVGSRMLITGPVRSEDLAALYAGAGAFCLPSFHEGFGLPLLEAMAHGVPCLAADRASLPEVGGEAAIYADPEEEEVMADCLGRLLEDEDLRARLAAAGPARAAEFTWERTARLTWQAYQEALA